MDNDLKEKARKLGFKALAANWSEYVNEPCIKRLLEQEEVDKNRRSLERRLRESQINEMKPAAEFDWVWPKKIDRELVEDLFTLKFVEEPANVIFMGPNGVGKTMLAKNLIHRALLAGYKTRFTSASQMLNDLSAQDGASARLKSLRKYTSPELLVIDELGYLSYDNRYADLLYEVINGRYMKSSTILTTNKPFQEWGEVFTNAGCVVTLVDRLMHKAEVVLIEGSSYRQREATERAGLRAEKKRGRNKKQGVEDNAESTDLS
ncbi:MAG: IS21-like element helper ATPase IstB [Candidatus Obscuribacterales bacterium]|nr:IS21-like element helper ATPase IstB [Candidatus Obscuribacterales bacterium]